MTNFLFKVIVATFVAFAVESSKPFLSPLLPRIITTVARAEVSNDTSHFGVNISCPDFGCENCKRKGYDDVGFERGERVATVTRKRRARD